MNKTLLLLEAAMCSLGYDSAPNTKPAVVENPRDPSHEEAIKDAAIEKRLRKNQKRLKDQRRERNRK